MIVAIAGILIVLWFLGFIGRIGGDLIHVLLIAAIVVIIYSFLTRKRRAG